MAGSNTPAGGPITGINVTPLVDITLVLLIIFMVTAKLIVNHDALAVDLPKAVTGDQIQDIFSVVLTAGGATQVNEAVVLSDDAILPLARSAHATNKELRAVIKADGAVEHRRVMHVLDVLRQAGVSRVGFGVVPEPPPTSEVR
jgi:biopolymer transport protein ExbD